MKQFFYMAFCVVALAACTGGFKKGDKGLEYKLIANGKGAKIALNDFIQLQIKQVYSGAKDTVLYDSHELMPRIQIYDSASTPMEYFKILGKMSKGDSMVIRIPSDSVLKALGQQAPPYMKKGKFIYTHITLVNIFKTREQADSANRAEQKVAKPKFFKKQLEEMDKIVASNKEQIEKDDKIIADYLAKNNIKAQKTKWGVYVAVQNEGSGNPIGFDDVVSVNYTGKTLDSAIVFDSNVDPKSPKPPYDVKIWEIGGVIAGWTDGLQALKNGSKATFYIPSSLGYGVNGNGPKIKPNENLVFDVEIKNVQSEEAYNSKQQQQQEEMIRKMQEEANKAKVDTVRKK